MQNFVMLLVMLLTSMIAGAVWTLLSAFFCANWQTNETLFTLMMNYIAMQITALTSGQFPKVHDK